MSDQGKKPCEAREEVVCLVCMEGFTEDRKAYPLPCYYECNDSPVHYRCIMAWLATNSTCPLCRGPTDALSLEARCPLDTTDAKRFAISVVPADTGIVRCKLRVLNRGWLKQPHFELYLQRFTNSVAAPEQEFLLSAKKQRRSNMTSNYQISCQTLDDFDEGIVGRVSSNFLGTQFTVYAAVTGESATTSQELADINSSGEDLSGPSPVKDEVEVGCITYDANRTTVGPRKMRVCVPKVLSEGLTANSSAMLSELPRDGPRLSTMLQRGDTEDLKLFHNREPVFREDLGAYCLDFGGRVSLASVKNFQLVCEGDSSLGNIVQFGRTSNDSFSLDFQHPLSPLQALGICLSSYDTKIACV